MALCSPWATSGQASHTLRGGHGHDGPWRCCAGLTGLGAQKPHAKWEAGHRCGAMTVLVLGLLKMCASDTTRISTENSSTSAWSAQTDKKLLQGSGRRGVWERSGRGEERFPPPVCLLCPCAVRVSSLMWAGQAVTPRGGFAQ